MNVVRRWYVFFIALLCLGSAVAQQIPENTYQELRWRMVGPFRGGRTRAAVGVASQPNVFYMGQVDGGVWRSTDFGRTWEPIFDNQPTQSIGDIAVAESDPNIIYVATGEGLRRPDLSVGDGIYKTTDGGKTWTNIGLSDGQAIPAIRIDPKDPNRVFVAVLGHPYGPNKERGIFRSTDGGKTWQNVLYKDENTGGSDEEIDPQNPNVVYACMWESRQGPWEDGNEYGGPGGGLFKSTDGGNTWHQLTKGLPTNLVQINVAIAPSQPSRLYASLSTTEPTEYGTSKGVGFYRSDDAGETWVKITDDPRPSMKIGGGDLPVPVVDPKNPDVVYSASIVAHKSTDGGKTWQSWRGAPGGDDYQNLWINPNNPNIILLVSDQGAIITENGGVTWSSWFNQPTAQLYHAVADNSFPYKVCSGQQESGSVCISSRGNEGEITNSHWHPVGVIEYGYAAPDPLDTNIVFGAGRNEVSKYYWDTGQVQNVTPIPVREKKYRAERTEPIVFSPIDPHTMYYTANVVFKTTDGGEHWTIISPDLSRPNPGVPATVAGLIKGSGVGGGYVPPGTKPASANEQHGAVYALAPSFKNINTLWAGTDDGAVWVTRDGGKNWTNITPPEVGGWNKVTQIQASHFDDNTAYISVSRFRIDDLTPLIFRTRDGGKTWQQITTGIANGEPVDTVREDPVRRGLLFAGTEKSVWVSFDDGDHWQSLQLNLPHTSMRDLWIKDSDLIVATHGRGFWILDDITPLRQVTAQVTQAQMHLFNPAPAWRVMRSTWPDTPIPPDEPMAENPPDGAVLDYYLGSAASGPVTLQIVDGSGKVARRYSDDKPELTQEEIQKQLIPPYWLRPFRTPQTSAGMH
ncbi:MAG: WD40/YVTN/BNR-like repeat-containing protein, partial [Terriglobales bacterium]